MGFSHRFVVLGAAASGIVLAIACGSSSGNPSNNGGGGGGAEPPATCDAGCVDGQVTTGPPGELDPSFGKGGAATAPMTNAFAVSSGWLGMKRGDDGSIYVAFTGDGTGIARFHADGTVDKTYGTDGIGLASDRRVAQAFGVDASGRVLLIAQAPSDGGASSAGYVLVRLTAAGALDASFGTGGVAGPFTDTPAFYPHFVVPRADGATLLVGFADNAPGAAFALHGGDGARDSGFGGVKRDPAAPASPTDVLTQSDGSLVVLTMLSNGPTTSATLRHYDVNGTPDTSFGMGGSVAVPLPDDGGRETTGVLGAVPQGAGIVFGYAVSPYSDGGPWAGAFRVTPQGAPDKAFAGTGSVNVVVDRAGGYPSVSGVAVAGDNVALGGFRQTSVGSGHAWLTELTQDAGLSAAFDQGAADDAGFARSGAFEVYGMIREPGSGKLLVGASVGTRFVVARVFP